MGGNDYLGLMKGIGIVGLLAAVTYALLSQRGQAAGSFFMGFVFVYAVMFVPKVVVTVHDVRAPAVYAVANVPLGLAAPYATISHIGHWLTQQYETRFTPLNDERFSKSGMVFGARILETLSVQGFPDPALKSDISTFYKDCVVPELVDDASKSKTIRNSKEISVTLAAMMNPGRGTVLGSVQYAGSSAMACTDVIAAINAYLAASNAANEAMGKIGRVVRADEGVSMATPLLISTTETDLNNMLGNLVGISDTAQQTLVQTMWINGIHDADMALRNGYGNAAATSYTTAVTEQSGRQNAYTGKLWAEKGLPLIRNIAEFVLISAFPMVFIIMLMAGENAMKGLKLYMVALASLALWAPFTAILNSLVINNGRQALLAMKASGGGLTLDNLNGVIDLALQQQSLAGQLFLAVPIIAFAIVSAGAQATTSAVGGLTSSAAGAAGQVSGQVAQGNVSAGQVGWQNTTAMNTSTGQSNTAQTIRSGFAQFESGAGTLTMGGGAPGGGVMSARSNQMGSLMPSVETGLENSFGKTAAASMSASRSSIASALESIKAAHASGFRTESSSMAESKFTAALGASTSTERAQLAGEGAAFASRASQEATHQDALRNAVGTTAGGKLGLSIAGTGIGVGAESSETTARTNATNASTGNSAERRQDFSLGKSVRDGTTDSTTATTTRGNSSSESRSFQASMESAHQRGLQGQAQAQASTQATEQIQAVRSDRGGIRQDLSNQVVERMGGAAAAMAMFSSDSAGFTKAASKVADEIIAERGLGPSAGTQIEGVSGAAQVTSFQVDSNKAATEGKVQREIANAPAAADAPPSEGGVSAGPVPAVGGGGNNPRSQANPWSSGSGGQPAMPASVASPDGSGQRDSSDTLHKAALEPAKVGSEISSERAETMRKVGNQSDKARDKVS